MCGNCSLKKLESACDGQRLAGELLGDRAKNQGSKKAEQVLGGARGYPGELA